MTTTYACIVCGEQFIDDGLRNLHVAACRMRSRERKIVRAYPFTEYPTQALAQAIIELAALKDPNKGVTDDIDRMILRAYEFMGQTAPQETWTITVPDAMKNLDEWLDELDEQYGPPSPEVVAEVQAELDAAWGGNHD
jgi:hypothetical protein